MSLSKVLRLARTRQPTAILRHSSSDNHTHQEEHEYPAEGFQSSFWVGSVLFSSLVVAFYKFAPEPGEDVFITRSLAKYGTSRDVLEKINFQHLLLSQQASANTLLVADAKRPPIHRYRYPQSFEQASPHMQMVGGTADLSGLKVKGDRE